jgi:hypothetical protein
MKENRMETPAVASLQAQAEPLAALSISHLSPSTRLKLADDELSVNAYPTDCGGILYVGAPRATGSRPKPIWPRSSRSRSKPASSG